MEPRVPQNLTNKALSAMSHPATPDSTPPGYTPSHAIAVDEQGVAHLQAVPVAEDDRVDADAVEVDAVAAVAVLARVLGAVTGEQQVLAGDARGVDADVAPLAAADDEHVGSEDDAGRGARAP